MALHRACDSCRRRKVKCDFTTPCANCRTSLISCQYAAVPRKRGRPRNTSTSTPLSPTTLPQEQPVPHALASLASVDLGRSDPFREIHASVSPSHCVNVFSTPSGTTILPSFEITSDAARLYTTLVHVANGFLTPRTILHMVNECIDVFMQYLFPNTPICHEPTLRDAASLFSQESQVDLGREQAFSGAQWQVTHGRPFALITALCAYVISVLSPSILSLPNQLATPFLQSSLSMLRLYEVYDLEIPDSTSLTIRAWQSSAMQNTTGKPGAAYHYHGEACLLAHRLRLYDEKSIVRSSLLESELLRLNFWLLYCADQAASTLGDRPPLFHSSMVGSNLTLRECGTSEIPLLDETSKTYHPSLQQRLLVGFHLKRRLWCLASDLTTGIKAYGELKKQGSNQLDTESSHRIRLFEAFVEFTGMMDEIPSWLRYVDVSDGPAGEDNRDDDMEEQITKYQRVCFWAQRSNIMPVYYCCSIVILQRCIDFNVPEILGLDGHSLSYAFRKLEIARDFVREIRIAPFMSLKAQGEPAVQRIREVGSILLQLIQNTSHKGIKGRAEFIFAQLLDLLAKLDSKASDELGGGNGGQTAAVSL
ncbi:hypothetical protein BKA66DRAFT_566964 [Pyrenochaeta sp. MPI-SDFR-AT-0127]|nr:hypothetical protein BKA66DRAFT_566964 [Pyrenochaeta sp. MPI-SDFR-AT-0127]